LKILKLAAFCLACAFPAAFPAAAAAQALTAGPQQIVDGLLAADRAFAAAAADTDTVSALAAMFHDDVIMPLPDGAFARGRAAAAAALRANPFNPASRAQWTPIRGGVSADGAHGFTLGYMTMHGNDGSIRLAKYLAYWVHTPQGWRVAAYKRAPRPEGAVSLAMLPPSLPARLAAPAPDPAMVAGYRESLRRAEQAFSDEAQRIGLGPAFLRYGRADAVNMGGQASFAVGAATIADFVGGDSPDSPVNWGADEALTAASGDLGVTFGTIRPNRPTTEGRPTASAFFTIWRRDSPSDRWLYIAE